MWGTWNISVVVKWIRQIKSLSVTLVLHDMNRKTIAEETSLKFGGPRFMIMKLFLARHMIVKEAWLENGGSLEISCSPEFQWNRWFIIPSLVLLILKSVSCFGRQASYKSRIVIFHSDTRIDVNNAKTANLTDHQSKRKALWRWITANSVDTS